MTRDDDARFLAQRSEQGYVHDVHHAMRDEPEAVSEADQLHITRQAERREVERRQDAWRSARATITTALEAFSRSPTVRSDPGIEGVLQGVWHRLRAVDKRVGA